MYDISRFMSDNDMGKNIIKLLIAAVVGLFVNVNAIGTVSQDGFVDDIVRTLIDERSDSDEGQYVALHNGKQASVKFDKLGLAHGVEKSNLIGAMKKHLQEHRHVMADEAKVSTLIDLAKSRAEREDKIISGYECSLNELQNIEISGVEFLRGEGVGRKDKLYKVKHKDVNCFIVISAVSDDGKIAVVRNIPCGESLLVVGMSSDGKELMNVKSVYPHQDALIKVEGKVKGHLDNRKRIKLARERSKYTWSAE